MKDISHGDFPIKPRDDGEAGLSRSQRQWLQVEKVQNGDESPFVDVNNLSLEMKNWDYPLHFIDFETSTVAIPFHAGRRPYEQIAFQFSHHQVSSTGAIEHAGQYINTRPGVFPNFEFLRNLRSELASDEGTIFRYSNHENSVLCQIYAQLDRSDEPDKRELMAFIKTITKKKEGSGKNEVVLWEGRRNMIDLCKLVQRFYYHPKTNGSNSIKHVLPAVLFDSEYLRSKYSKGIYGSDQNMRSLNFSKKTWIEYDSNGGVIDPYKQLPPVFDQYDKDTLDLLMEDDELRNGGAAMTAYAYLPFTQMTDTERERISAALLKYCELDTFAMVMIFEHWQNLVRKSGLAKVG
ncbi:MAG: DUF2779 domain-containing protein [Bdellovibrionales bacterium]|nr:DUF2779 domain-containing protein [Bdellovibrionales bacterium]